MPRGVVPQVRNHRHTILKRKPLELRKEVEIDLLGIQDPAADGVTRRVEKAELRERVRHERGHDTRHLREPEQGAEGDRQEDGDADGGPDADKNAGGDRRGHLERILPLGEHAVIVNAAEPLEPGLALVNTLMLKTDHFVRKCRKVIRPSETKSTCFFHFDTWKGGEKFGIRNSEFGQLYKARVVDVLARTLPSRTVGT